MNPIRRWKNSYEHHIEPIFQCRTPSYFTLFRRYVMENIATPKERREAIRQFRGPCFGLCMALVEGPHRTIMNEEFIKTALRYSLIDTLRQELLFPFDIKTTITRDQDTSVAEYLQHIKEILLQQSGSSVLLRIWNGKTRTTVIPHAIFLCLDQAEQRFYFFDTKLKARVGAENVEVFANLFTNYLKEVRPNYLREDVILRFESKRITDTHHSTPLFQPP